MVLEPENERMTGRPVKLAARRFLADLQRTDIYFDEEEANKFVAFAHNHCKLWEGKTWRGKPVILEPWMQFIFQQVYGWFYVGTGLRRIQKVYVQVAKKNAKSTLCGVLALFHLFADERIQTPKIFVGANNDEQAKICVNIAGQMVKASPDLCAFLDDKTVTLHNYGANIHTVVHKERVGFIKSVAKETGDKTSKQAGGKHGINPSLWIIDEYGMADSSDLLDTFDTAQAAQEEPLGFIITTAGHKRNGPAFALRNTGIEVMEGTKEDDGFLAFIYESDTYYVDEKGELKKDDQGKPIRDSIYDKTTWRKTNPNLGVSVFESNLERYVTKARNEGANTEVNIRTLNFNEWCDTPEVWIPRETWDMNSHGMKPEDLEGLRCFGSLKVISGKELNAWTFFFPNVEDNLHAVRTLFFMPRKALLLNPDKQDFKQWEKHIIVDEGNVIDNDFIFERIMEEIQKYDLHSFSFPVSQENNAIVQALVKEGIEGNPISEGYRGNSEPTFAWESLLNAHQIEHFNNPVLAWNNSQCMAIRRGDEIRVERAGSRTAGIVCCINALAQWKTVEANEEEAGIDFIEL